MAAVRHLEFCGTHYCREELHIRPIYENTNFCGDISNVGRVIAEL